MVPWFLLGYLTVLQTTCNGTVHRGLARTVGILLGSFFGWLGMKLFGGSLAALIAFCSVTVFIDIFAFADPHHPLDGFSKRWGYSGMVFTYTQSLVVTLATGDLGGLTGQYGSAQPGTLNAKPTTVHFSMHHPCAAGHRLTPIFALYHLHDYPILKACSRWSTLGSGMAQCDIEILLCFACRGSGLPGDYPNFEQSYGHSFGCYCGSSATLRQFGDVCLQQLQPGYAGVHKRSQSLSAGFTRAFRIA